MKRLLIALVTIGLVGGIGWARAGEKTGAPKEGHLGLGVMSVPEVLHSQLPGVLPKGQGVLVEQVAKDSPAAKAGLQAHDILLNFGDQKLYAPEQLVKLVRHDKPGQVVAVDFLRGGKKMSCNITLDAATHRNAHENDHVYRLFPDGRLHKRFDNSDAKSGDAAWQMFDAIKLTRQDGKHWRAEVEYRNKDGKKDSKAYTGTRDEIRKAIEAEKDLPPAERTQLLRALNLHAPVFEFHFPPFGAIDEDGHSNQP
jgi:major membrane immunogen (membrane-anchored lipoprotein)